MVGNEQFFLNGKALDLTMLDFWRFKYSNIYNMQEYIAEFLIAKALGKNKADNDAYWTLWDIDYRGKRIEVKETSYYHPWNKDGKVSKQRGFKINKANSSYEDETKENRFERQNDVYVFCLNRGNTAEESNPLNLDNWEFYVVPTDEINLECGDNKTISLGRLRSMGYEPKRYDKIKESVDALIDHMELLESEKFPRKQNVRFVTNNGKSIGSGSFKRYNDEIAYLSYIYIVPSDEYSEAELYQELYEKLEKDLQADEYMKVLVLLEDEMELGFWLSKGFYETTMNVDKEKISKLDGSCFQYKYILIKELK